jgi:HAE1 family hydrophobic/amphiphilic exporter-1
MFLSDISIRRPVFATMMIAALLLFGIISRQRMGVALYPEVDFPNVSVSTTLQGASPEVIETEVTDPVEDAISSVEGIKHINSSNFQGFSQVRVEFNLEKNIDTAAQDIRDKISLANRFLPRDSDPPVINKVDMTSHPIFWLSVNGNVPRKYLGQVADEIFKPRLETLQGVGTIVIGGLQEREMRVWLDAQKMEAYHIIASDVEAALQNKNIEVPGGRIESATRELTVKTMGELASAEAFNRLIIAYREGTPIRLRDIGFAEDGVADQRSMGRFQGVNAIGMGIVPRSGANHVAVCSLVKKTMKELQKIAPPGIDIAIAFDSSEFIKNSIADVQFDLLFGALLASLVVFFFLRSLRSTLIISLAIPTSLIGTFSIMYALGFTMNSMTMLALSLCVGLVIDDAIVVLENIFRHLCSHCRNARYRGCLCPGCFYQWHHREILLSIRGYRFRRSAHFSFRGLHPYPCALLTLFENQKKTRKHVCHFRKCLFKGRWHVQKKSCRLSGASILSDHPCDRYFCCKPRFVRASRYRAYPKRGQG